MDFLEINRREQIVLLNKVLKFLEDNREIVDVYENSSEFIFIKDDYSYSVIVPDTHLFVFKDGQAIIVRGDNNRAKPILEKILALLKDIIKENLRKRKKTFLKNMEL